MKIRNPLFTVLIHVVFLLAPCATSADTDTSHDGPRRTEQRNNGIQYCSQSFQGQTAASQADPLACGPPQEKHELITPKSEHPTPAPSPEKALIYMVRKKLARFRASSQNKIAADGQWVAVLKAGNYSFIEVDPGLVRFCFAGVVGFKELDGYLFLTAEAGKTYYLRGDSGAVGHRAVLVELSEEEGKKLIAESKYATFKVKR